jgi:hypothetical protein
MDTTHSFTLTHSHPERMGEAFTKGYTILNIVALFRATNQAAKYRYP